MKLKLIFYSLLTTFLFYNEAYSQNNIQSSFYEGIIVGGYVDNGAYVNFTGPNIKWQKFKSTFSIGMLPSLRFKKDKSITTNSFITPSLGIGITYIYKSLAIQVPLYYNGKNSTQNGNWQLGIGLGYRLKNKS